jgi:hypothetical protein
MGGLYLFGGLFSVLFLLVPIILVLGLVVILALRHDDDVDAARAPAIYGSVVAYLGLLTVLFAATGAAAAVADYSRDSYDGNEGATTGLVVAVIAAIVGLAVLGVHRTLFARRFAVSGAAKRVHRAYVLVLCLTVVLVGAAAGGITLYQLYGVLFPDTADMARGDALRGLAPAVVLLAGCGILWRWHWEELDLGPALPQQPLHDDDV